ncbi:urate hydroxylase PuuD [Pararhodobacter zhoushanensis]|uniref:Urate hydroxylase PuuD n=1 Tax=Pararhodobacter zhoushanensis TaxID=2479545 RepID=A0ABT3H493_9RHOB|nr:urate hydroxylase PuuD [Pararhodobacter zhoushanensis]MCW1934632.1 urate hydroxylase PuuD [Pararhodobacter zhoushanensis]
MFELAIIGAWAEFALRWLHVITAMAWIGSSFYFIALDLGLNRNIPGPADGEEWQVHGGGFYHIQKYLVAPATMPDHLIWFKWESYMTWISGFALMCMVYYLGSEFYLIDPAVMDLAPWQAIGISLVSLAFGWLVYDQICRRFVNSNQTLVMVALYVVLVGMAYFYTSVFTGRAAMIHLGAWTATIMTANVFMVIMPNQRIVVADLQAGRKPDAKYGKIAKQRSTHNNYLTLPVIFLMLSNHYPLAFGTQYTWIIASLVFLMGVTIRHYFNSKHARKGNPTWTWAVTAVIFIVIMWLSIAPAMRAEEDLASLPPSVARFAQAEEFSEVHNVVVGRCSMCHSEYPVYPGINWAPHGLMLDTEAQVARAARLVYLQAGRAHAMPPANVSWMEEDERALIRQWYQSVAGVQG